jgi:creatinine amidohydrolase
MGGVSRMSRALAGGLALAIALASGMAEAKGVLLEELSWPEAERALGPLSIAVFPLGAAAKEHGPHLPLRNDFLIAEYLKRRVLAAADVVVYPTVNYGYYPAFVEYPGSTTLRLETARDLIVDLCRSAARHGPRRCYVLNTGISTLASLAPAAEILRKDGIALAYTDLRKASGAARRAVEQQEGGSHADEIETSMMLYIAPEIVRMDKAAKDYHPAEGGLTRDPKGAGAFSPTGIYGDATLATRRKGQKVVEALVAGILADLAALKAAPLPPHQQ